MKYNKTKPYHFGAGPAMLPASLLLEIQAELCNWQNTGMSILEIGHRTPAFKELLNQAETKLRNLLLIPDNYHILFLGGNTRALFAIIAINFLNDDDQAGYIVS